MFINWTPKCAVDPTSAGGLSNPIVMHRRGVRCISQRFKFIPPAQQLAQLHHAIVGIAEEENIPAHELLHCRDHSATTLI
jgi:hypothetical protein